MTQKINLKKIERKTYMSFHQDGLLDILIGLVVLCFGINMATNQGTWIMLCWMPILLLAPAKKWITYPRMGFVKFSPARKAGEKKIKVMIIIGLSVTIIGVGVIFTAFNELPLWIKDNPLVFFGVIWVGLLILIAYLSRINRFYTYALLTLIAFIGSYFFKLPHSLPEIALGAIILLSGLVLLIRFLHNYSIPKEGSL